LQCTLRRWHSAAYTRAPMRRTIVVLLMLLSMVWQVTAFAGPMGLARAGEDLTHAVLHWQEAAHHHHEDGSYHQDASHESTAHVAVDAALAVPAIWSATALQIPAPGDGAHPTLTDVEADPGPSLQRLRRPPRTDL
jgi:hypothetical protein